MMPFGDKEIRITGILKLAKYFEIQEGEDEDALYLTPSKESYTRDDIIDIIDWIGEWQPDEVNIEDLKIRFWWD